jgi:hypothetical protein
MQNTNEVILTGTFRTEQVTPTFEKQILTFASKNREQQWEDGDLDIYIKPEVIQQSGVNSGDKIKAKGFMVFSFFTKQDGTKMTFPKMIVTEIQEIEKAGAGDQQSFQNQAAPIQPTQPTGYAAGVPPVPGQAPTAPVAPQGGVPPMPPAPGMAPAV